MRIKNFTLKSMLVATLLFVGSSALMAQNTGTGPGWGNLGFGEQLIVSEDFTSFDFFGNWVHANNSNSKPVVDDIGNIVRGTQEGTKTMNFLNSTEYSFIYTWDSCAFAPEWGVANSVTNDGIPVESDPTTSGVSNGFIEISRNYPSQNTKPGEFIVDLRSADFIEGIEYSHSSCGGKRRGLALLLSLDDAATWDTIRYQPGDGWGDSYTADPYTLERTPNDYSCEPSANGMLWEDGIYADNVMLKFICETKNNQALRIHDLKVYGTLPDPGAVNQIEGSFNFRILNDRVVLSENANVHIYEISGKLVNSMTDVKTLSMANMTNGVYILKAQAGNKVITTKFVKR